MNIQFYVSAVTYYSSVTMERKTSLALFSKCNTNYEVFGLKEEIVSIQSQSLRKGEV